MRRSLVNLFVAGLSLAPLGCAHKEEVKATNEVTQSDKLSYTMQLDATRLVRGTGLSPVVASSRLVEEDLASYFQVREVPGGTDARRELIAEAPAPGYGVHAVIEERPDQYCFLSLDVVAIGADGAMTGVSVAPYSVHFGVDKVRAALSSLRGTNRPAMSKARFDDLRAQARELASRNEDPAIDASTYARTPRPLDNLDDAPRYYAPSTTRNTLRGEP